MKRVNVRRYRRRAASGEVVSLKKDQQQEHQFFGEGTQEPFFKPGNSQSQSPVVQRKCDGCEKEDKVQRMPEKKEEEKVQRSPEKKEEEKVMKKEEKKEEEKIQKKETASASPASPSSAASYISSIQGKGQPMPESTQSFYESRMGGDFSNVKIHTDKEAAESAKDLQAEAYAYGNHIVFNEGKYQPESAEGKKLLAHELAHVMQADPEKISRQPSSGSGWTTLVKDGLDFYNAGKPDDCEKNLIDALKLIGHTNVNVARDGKKNPSLLKPGLNLDIENTDTAGNAGYLYGTTFTGEMPMDQPNPDFAEIIGRHAFVSAYDQYTIMVIEHEKTHTTHHKRALETYKKWEAKGNTKSFQKKFSKQKADILKLGATQQLTSDQIEKNVKQVKVNLIDAWLSSQKSIDNADKALFFEAAGTMKTQHFITEVLSGLGGFIKGFHLIPVKNGEATFDLFHELTYYPVNKQFWKGMGKATKAEYLKIITDYYCNTLSADHQAAFKKHVKDYKGKGTVTDESTAYYKMLENISCKK